MVVIRMLNKEQASSVDMGFQLFFGFFGGTGV
jgi:hypothetical protein